MHHRKHILIVGLCLLSAVVVGVRVPRVLADDACNVPTSSVYVLQTDAELSADDVALVNDWQTDDTRWGEATERKSACASRDTTPGMVAKHHGQFTNTVRHIGVCAELNRRDGVVFAYSRTLHNCSKENV